MTGMTSSIIQSALLPELVKASTTLSRLAIFFRLASEVASFITARSSSPRPTIPSPYLLSDGATARSSSSTASPPMPAVNESEPCSSMALW